MKLLLLAVGALVGYWVGRQVGETADAWDDYRGHPNVERPTTDDIDWLREFNQTWNGEPLTTRTFSGGLN